MQMLPSAFGLASPGTGWSRTINDLFLAGFWDVQSLLAQELVGSHHRTHSKGTVIPRQH